MRQTIENTEVRHIIAGNYGEKYYRNIQTKLERYKAIQMAGARHIDDGLDEVVDYLVDAAYELNVSTSMDELLAELGTAYSELS